jgi:hypothetical protein
MRIHRGGSPAAALAALVMAVAREHERRGHLKPNRRSCSRPSAGIQSCPSPRSTTIETLRCPRAKVRPAVLRQVLLTPTGPDSAAPRVLLSSPDEPLVIR